MIIIITIFI